MASTFQSHQKTAVLVITTHGDIKVEFSSTTELHPIMIHPIMTAEPDGMDIVLLQTAACGIVNMVPPINVVSYTKTIRDAIKTSEFNENTTKSDMMSIAERVKVEIMQIDNQPADVAREISSKNTNFSEDPQTIDYHHHNNKFYNIYGDKNIVDKRFSRANKLTKPGSRDLKVNLLGAPNEDLMNTLNPHISSLRNSHKRHEPSVLYMRNIIKELQKRGITKLLIFDFTCSVIENDVSDRVTRHTRRSFMKGGGTAPRKSRKSTGRYKKPTMPSKLGGGSRKRRGRML